MSGSVITDITLTTAVYEMDRAVSPPANFVRILDVTPPGQQARIIRPTAISPDKPKMLAMPNPTIGKITIWLPNPTANAFGSVRIRPKSDTFRPSPSENMIYARESGRTTSMIMLDSSSTLSSVS